MKKRKWSKIFLILYVICVLSYTAARIILKEYGYFYYDFFEKGKILPGYDSIRYFEDGMS